MGQAIGSIGDKLGGVFNPHVSGTPYNVGELTDQGYSMKDIAGMDPKLAVRQGAISGALGGVADWMSGGQQQQMPDQMPMQQVSQPQVQMDPIMGGDYLDKMKQRYKRSGFVQPKPGERVDPFAMY